MTARVLVNLLRSYRIARLIVAESEYKHDPDHKHKPQGGGWRKTEEGWSRHKERGQSAPDDAGLAERTPVRKLDMTGKGTGQSFKLDLGQIAPNDVVALPGPDGKSITKQFGDLTPAEREFTEKTLQTIGSFSHEGFSDYSTVDHKTFKANMARNLDFIADKKYPETANERTTPVRENAEAFKKTLAENLGNLRRRYAVAVHSKAARQRLDEYADTLGRVIDEAVKDGSIGDVRECDLDAFIQEDMKLLVYQEMETRRRSMGDHGIRHLLGNALNSVALLDELRKGGISKDTDGMSKMLALTCQVNHDIGYSLGAVATDAGSGTYHKSYSGLIASQERDRYAKVFGDAGADKLYGKFKCYPGTDTPVRKGNAKQYAKNPEMFQEPVPVIDKETGKQAIDKKSGKPVFDYLLTPEAAAALKPGDELYQKTKVSHEAGHHGAILYHDDSNYDWENDPFGSSIALADCTALFGKDKVQEFFLEDDVAMECAVKMHTIKTATLDPDPDKDSALKEELFVGMKEALHDRIDKLPGLLPFDRSMLYQQVEEMSLMNFSTPNDILTRSSGRLDGFHYDPKEKSMTVATSYSQDGKVLDDLFGSKMSRNQWNKMAEGDLHIKERGGDGKGGRNVVFENPKGASPVRVTIAGFDDTRPKTGGVARAYEHLKSRMFIQQLARLGQSTSNADKAEYNNRVNDLKAPADPRDSRGPTKGELIFGSQWEKVKEILAKENGAGKWDELARLGLSDEEKAYLMGDFQKRVKRVSHRTARIARRLAASYMDDHIRHFEIDVGNFHFTPDTGGECAVTFINKPNDARRNWCWDTKIPEGMAGVNEFAARLRRHRAVVENGDIQKFFRLSGYKWKGYFGATGN